MSPQLFEFHLPLAPEELLKSRGVNQYVVQEVLPVRQLPAQLRGKPGDAGSAPGASEEHPTDGAFRSWFREGSQLAFLDSAAFSLALCRMHDPKWRSGIQARPNQRLI